MFSVDPTQALKLQTHEKSDQFQLDKVCDHLSKDKQLGRLSKGLCLGESFFLPFNLSIQCMWIPIGIECLTQRRQNTSFGDPPFPVAISLIQWFYCHFCCSVAQSCPTVCGPWTLAHQAPLSMEFSRQEYWSGLPSPSPGDLSYPCLL